MSAVIWHDLECGSYQEDLEFWMELAAAAPGPVLEVGAGTGRVALGLARAGHEVIALDRDSGLLAELERRAAGLPIEILCADAREFQLQRPIGLCIVPMQTVQLFGGREGRMQFLGCVRAGLRPGGVIALAIAEGLEPFEPTCAWPVPDLVEIDGTVYCSQPTAICCRPSSYVLERRREAVDKGGEQTVSVDRITLDRVSSGELESEARELGLRVLPSRAIPPSGDYAGSEVVMLGG